MKPKQQNIVYDFLINEKFRLYRHITLFLSIVIITLNGALLVYSENIFILGANIYWIILFSIILYLTEIYLNLNFFVPKLLLKGKYLEYIIAIIISMLFVIFLDNFFEYAVHKLFNIPFNTFSLWYSSEKFIADFFHIFFAYSLFMIGISMSMLFRNWLKNEETLRNLETKNLRSQIEITKNQINPAFLSRMLRKSAILTQSNPLLSSGILIKLSKILRYQLYDCNREKVLLKAEIEFLNNYLNLEKETSESFDFTIHTEKIENTVFIPPFLFLPFIQSKIKYVQNGSEKFTLNIEFWEKDSNIIFTCYENLNKQNTYSLKIPATILYVN